MHRAGGYETEAKVFPMRDKTACNPLTLPRSKILLTDLSEGLEKNVFMVIIFPSFSTFPQHSTHSANMRSPQTAFQSLEQNIQCRQWVTRLIGHRVATHSTS